MIEGIDTYVRHVRLRLATINPNRQVKGPMSAQDWPVKRVIPEALYLLVLGDAPVGRAGFSPTVPIVHTTLQWAWVILGEDIADGVRGRNRGNRYRTDYEIKEELRQAVYPGFAPKVRLSAAPQTGALTATPFDSQEAIFWTPLEYGQQRQDRDSGVIYGIATTYITQMTDAITA